MKWILAYFDQWDYKYTKEDAIEIIPVEDLKE